MDKVDILTRKLNREIKARALAEDLLENKSRELYELNKALQDANDAIIAQQEQLVLSEKLSSLGMLAAGLAHEINNPLGFVIANMDTLSEYLSSLIKIISLAKHINANDLNNNKNIELFNKSYENEEIDYIISDINNVVEPVNEGLHRIKDIIKNVRDYSNIDKINDRQYTNLNNLIDTVIKTMSIAQNVYELVVSKGDIPDIYVNACEITQVITNILINAIQSFDKEKSEITIKTYLGSDDMINLEIQDNGMGMTEEQKGKIFNPFFSTKDNSTNTGLGLSISSRIIKAHSGKIIVNSKLEQGTTFIIKLPSAQKGVAIFNEKANNTHS